MARMTGGSWRPTRSSGARAGFVTLACVAAVGLVTLVSACGGSSSEGVAQVDSPQATTGGQDVGDGSGSLDMAGYAACMRRNGVPRFPDPDSQGRIQIEGGPGLDPNSPQFKAAAEECGKLLPKGGRDVLDPEEQRRGMQEALKYSACIRAHGVPGFPDPKPSGDGGINLDMGASRVNFDSPRFKAAEAACRDLAPGAGGDQQRRRAPNGTP